MKKICKQCGKEFELSNSEIEYFKSRNLEIPKRCKACREKNKAGDQNSVQVTGHPEDGSVKKMTGCIAVVAVLLVIILGAFVKNVFNKPVSDADTGISQPVVEVEEPNVEVEVSKPEVTVKVDEPEVEVEVEEPEVQIMVDEPAIDGQVITDTEAGQAKVTEYRFRNKKLLDQHYDKHGKEMGFASAEEYEAAASAVINNPDALYKTEKEDGDGCFYIESTNEFVVLSTDGYIRTYFNPDSGKKYFDKQ